MAMTRAAVEFEDGAWRDGVEFVIVRFITTGLRIIVQASF